MIRETSIQFNVARILSTLADYINKESQLSITLPSEQINGKDTSLAYLSGTNWNFFTSSPLVDESTFTEMSPHFAGTYVEEVIEELKNLHGYKLGRVRILALKPRECYTWHIDPEEYRVHIPIKTNPGAMFIWKSESGELITERMPNPGKVYEFDVKTFHTALNAWKEPRIHLVASVLR